MGSEAARQGDSAGRGRASAPLLLRLRVLMRRRRLDREIAAAATITWTAELRLRAGQLTEPRMRRRTAEHLRQLVAYADDRAPRTTTNPVVVERGAVRTGRRALLRIAERLEAEEAVGAAGMVLANRMLTDGVSPLFNPRSDGTVIQAVWRVQEALDRHVP